MMCIAQLRTLRFAFAALGFAKLTGGSSIMYAESDPFFIFGDSTTPLHYTWHGEGTLKFK